MNIGNSAKVSLPSGAELEMTLAPFLEGEKLFSATAKCLKTVKIDAEMKVDDVTSNVNALKDAFLEFITDREMKEAILGVLKRCTYNGQRITSWEIFDEAKAREDYLPVCWEVVKFNLTPFTKNLISKFSGLIASAKTNQQ